MIATEDKIRVSPGSQGAPAKRIARSDNETPCGLRAVKAPKRVSDNKL
jgi:hypothetical protein